jgi:hypothetical protein
MIRLPLMSFYLFWKKQHRLFFCLCYDEYVNEQKYILYVVATPIGNLEDMTYRAVRMLQNVDVILCEDTRVTRTLLQHYSIETPTQSYHTHSTSAKAEKF